MGALWDTVETGSPPIIGERSDRRWPMTGDQALFEPTDDASGYPLEPRFPREEYQLRIRRAREYMAART